jgi:thiol-disulfide isomerase/thioredoxin
VTQSRRRARRAPLVWATVIAAVGLALAGLTLVPLGPVADGSAGTLVGTRAPTLDAVDLDGRRWTLDEADGRLVWINYWATWCPPCRTEMPMMQRLHERFGDRLLIVGVDFGEDRDTVADFVERYDITYPIVLDPTLENFYRWSPQFGLPQHYFVGADGRVVRQINGELAPEAMLATVEELLAKAGRQ